MDRNNAFGQAVRYLRGRESQLQAAKRAGIKNSTWSDYENGKQYPTNRNKVKVAKGLQCELKYLEEVERKFRVGELSLDDSHTAMLQRIRMSELDQISDPLHKSVWEDVSAGFDHFRSAAFKLFTGVLKKPSSE